MATIERTLTIPLRRGFQNTPRWRRTQKAVAVLREQLQRHARRENVLIGANLNEFMWKHGMKNPPPKVKVTIWVEEDLAKAELSGFTFKEAVKSKKKEEPATLKDKLTAKLEGKGEKEEKAEGEDKAEEGKEVKKVPVEEKKEEKKEQKEKEPKTPKPAPKKEAKPAKKEAAAKPSQKVK